MMALVRFLAGLAFLIAVLAVVSDGTRTQPGAAGFTVTSLGEHWGRIAPASLKSAQAVVGRYSHPVVWNLTAAPLLKLPTWGVFGALGAVLAYAGRRRRRVNIFAN